MPGEMPRSLKLRHDHIRVGQRMPAVLAGLRAREMPIEMRVARAGNVRLAIELFALLGIGEIEAAVDHDPGRIGELAPRASTDRSGS